MIARTYCDETLPNSRRQTVVILFQALVLMSIISLFHLKYHKKTYRECFSGSLPVDGRDLNRFEISSTLRFPGRHLGDGPKFKRKFLKSRIAYCTAKYSLSFQLLDDSSVLLILGGDISQNLGPVKDPCSVCDKCVAKNH